MAERPVGEHVLEVLGHGLAVRVAHVAILGESARHDEVERGRQPRPQARGRGGSLLHHPHQDRGQRRGVEGLLAGEQLVQDAAEREEVGARVHRISLGLLRRHVGGRPEELSGGGEGRGLEAGDAEVHDLRLPVAEQHDVRGLDVAVDDLLRVRVVQGLRELGHDPRRLAPLHGRAPGHVLGEGAALHVLEGDVRRVRGGILADVVHHDDAGVGEDGRRPGLALEALLERGALAFGDGEADLDRLQRDAPAEVGVGRAVYDAHHSAAELALDLVAAKALRDFGGHSLSREGSPIL
jgi:hypothetical protein